MRAAPEPHDGDDSAALDVGAILRHMPDAAFAVSATGRIVAVNELLEKMFGHDPGELRGGLIDALVPERLRAVHAEHCADYFAHPRPRPIGAGLSLRALRKDGTEFPVEISLNPVTLADGPCVIAAVRDVSQSEKRYRAIFEQIGVGVAHTDFDGRLLDVNGKFCEVCGYTKQEALALDIRALTHRDDLDESLAGRQRMLAGGCTSHERDARLMSKAGEEIWVHIATSLVRGADGRPVHFTSLIRDITIERRAEEKRREAELRFRQVTDNIQEVFWLADTSKSDMLYVSPGYEAIWGRTTADLYASPHAWLDAIHPQDRERVSASGCTTEAAGGYDEEYRIVRPDGTVRWIRDRAFPVRDSGQTPARLAGVAEDITERRRAADELRESERRFSSMLQNIELVAMMLDREARITYCNDYLLELTGWTRQELAGRNWFDVLVAPECESSMRQVFHSLLAGQPDALHFENEIVTRSGERRLIRWNNTILQSPQGSITGTSSMGEDITALRGAQREIERTVKKLRRAVQSTIEVVSTIGELRDPYTHGHEHRVGQIATAIATELGLDSDRIEGVRVAGYLHDVGKIAVPAEILAKPARLSALEFELVKQHAQQSYEILKGMEFPWPVAEAAWQHHERMDGSGYPQGLKGGQIILEARILAVADTLEAMVSHRPYRASRGLAKALAEIERNRGKLYDPDVADACLRLIRTKGYRLPR